MSNYLYVVPQVIGIPFVEGGRDIKKDGGLDCWGLVPYIYNMIDPSLIIPDVNISCKTESSFEIHEEIMKERDTYGERYTLADDPIPAPSVIMIRHVDPIYTNHIGVYLGERKFVHTRIRVGVTLDSIDSPAWRRKIEGFYVPILKRS